LGVTTLRNIINKDVTLFSADTNRSFEAIAVTSHISQYYMINILSAISIVFVTTSHFLLLQVDYVVSHCNQKQALIEWHLAQNEVWKEKITKNNENMQKKYSK